MKQFGGGVSIVISTFNKKKYLLTTLLGLNNQAKEKSFEVILIIDACTDKTYENIVGLPLNYPLKILINQEKRGLAASRNIGIKHANAKHILFLDDDIILTDKFLYNLSVFLKSNPDNIHSGNLYKVKYDFVNSLFEKKNVNLFFDEKQLLNNTYFDPVYESLKIAGKDYDTRKVACWWGLVTGSNICISKKQLTEIGLFDENFISWGPEDVDMCYRAFKAGIELIYHDDNSLYHLDHHRNMPEINSSMLTNALKMVKKYNRAPELEAYIRFFNGVISLNGFNNVCAELNHKPLLKLDEYYMNLNSYINKNQLIKYKREND